MTMVHQNGSIPDDGAAIERLVALGDLEGLRPLERAQYYRRVCESLGLNPLTQPFAYIKLNGKLTLYAKRDTTDQLRKLYAVSVEIVSRERTDDLYIVTARATTPDGRRDESIGAVTIAGQKGETLSNSLMKAETKAKRRVTLSICGLGWLDETEVADVRSAKRVEVSAGGEIIEAKPEPASGPDLTKALAASIDWDKWAQRHLDSMRQAAKEGMGALNEAWLDVNDDVKKLKAGGQPAPEAHVEALKAGKDELKTSAKGAA
jgi:hypothetical protein